ncbi:MAG: hypothetical protein J6023_04690 [Clostridia bacterium]|nr:hypothetical protein [Clostridia bacterium]
MSNRFKQLLCFGLIVWMISGVFTGALALTDENTPSIMVDDCETAWGGMVLDPNEKTQGDNSLSYTFNTRTLADSTEPGGNSLIVIQRVYETPRDVTGQTAFTFDFYASSVDFLDELSSGQFEVTSSGVCDEEEKNWDVSESLAKIKPGWNHIILDLTKSPFKPEHFNFFRLYMWFSTSKSKDKDVTIKFDNMCFRGVDYVVPISGLENLDGLTATKKLTLDPVGKRQGDYSVKWQLDPAVDTGFSLEVVTEPKDLSHNNVVSFYLYISNADFCTKWQKTLTVRVGSSAQAYYEWNVLELLIVPLELGWNKLVLTIGNGDGKTGPDIEQISYFGLFIRDIEGSGTTKTTFRLDEIRGDTVNSELHIGAGENMGQTSVSNGREYDDPDEVTLSEKETGGGTMLDDADAELSKNTYNTDHAKVVASITASVLFSVTTVVVCVFLILKIKKNAI